MTKVTKEDDRYVMSRAEDHSFWAQSAYLMEKYKALVWLLGAFLIAMGFDFRLPGQTMKHMQVEIDSLKTKTERVDSVIGRKQDIQLRLWCASTSVSAHDKDLSGLKCPP